MLRPFIVGVGYQTPAGNPGGWRALVVAKDEDHAQRLGVSRCKRERRVGRIDGGDVSEIHTIGGKAARSKCRA